jgi:hypothetical protein
MSVKFSKASCEDVDDFTSLEHSSLPDCAVPESPIEEIPHPEMSDIKKDQSMLNSDPTQVYEKSYEATLLNGVEKYDVPAAQPESIHETTLTPSDPGHVLLLEPEPLTKPKPEPVAKAPPAKEEVDRLVATEIAVGKERKGMKSKEPEIEETFPPPVEPEPEPGLERESEPAKEEPALDPFAGLSKSEKRKLQQKMKKDAKAKEEEDAKRKEDNSAALKCQKEDAEVERVRLEEEEAEKKFLEEREATAAAVAGAKNKEDIFIADCGAIAPTTSTGKKRKSAREEANVEEFPLLPPKPDPGIEPEPTPPPEEKVAES